MQKAGLSDRIIKLDRNIRFVGVVNSKGEVVEGGFHQGVSPLLDGTDEQQMYVQALSNMNILKQFSDRLGKVRYSITEHERVILLTVPLSDGILCVSASSKANATKIRDKVLKAVKARTRKTQAGRKSNAKS